MPKKEVKVSPLKINLLASKSFNSSALGKTVNWALTIGKSIVFLTFSVVIFTLFYRFSLDKKVETLNDKIDENISTIQTYAEIEQQIHKVQNKIELIKEIETNDHKAIKVFQKVEASLSPTTNLSSFVINLSSQTVSLKGKTVNEVVFSQMLNALKRQEEFTEISIDELKSGGVANPQIDFVINIKFEKIS